MNTMSRCRPFHPQSFFGDLFKESNGASWSPNVDVLETEEGYQIVAEVPGLDPAQLEVTLENRTLTLKGEKKPEDERKDEKLHIVERRYGTFQRVFTFPVDIDPESIDATSQNGLLTIKLSKIPAVLPRKIEIKQGE